MFFLRIVRSPGHRRRAAARHGCRWWLALAFSLFAPAHPVFAQEDHNFAIFNNQDLSQALIQFSHQSGLAIVFPDHLARDLPARELRGPMSPEAALYALLADTGLAWRLVDGRIIAVYDARCELTDSCPEPEQLLLQNPLYTPGLEELYVYGSQVTGSRIRRNYLQGSAPVDIITAPDIELSGAQTIGELLRRMPAVSGNSMSTAISRGGDGTATVTLRGLPAASTLVLVNGRRIANDGLAGESLDLNTIAPAAVERIEIFKDGASAIYGSEAIAGVINIIMKQDFYGFLAEHYYGIAELGDGATSATTLQYGTGFPHGSFFISASHFDQGEIHARDRPVSASADGRDRGGADLRSSATPTARISLPDGRVVIRDQASGEFRAVGGDDLFNFPDFKSALVPSERDFVYAHASYDFSEQLTGAIELSYTETRSQANFAYTPVFTAFEQLPLTVSADNRYNPFGVDITDLRRSFSELPPRRQDNNSEVERLALIVQGLHGGWDWEFSHSWSRNKARELFRGAIDAEHLQRGIGPAADCRGLEVDGCVPINLFGPAGSIDRQQLDFLATTTKVVGETKLSSYSLTGARNLFHLPYGIVDFAAGMEYRDESASKKPDRLLSRGRTIGGNNAEPTHGGRDIFELYFESIAPLWHSVDQGQQLDLEIALRFSRYSDFGDISNPKYGVRWQLNDSWMIRGTHSQGFRAPTLNELYQGRSAAQALLTDPCALPENVGRLPGCRQPADASRNQFLTISGGNPRLNPEKSRSYTVGLVWTPKKFAGLNAMVDFYDTESSQVVDSSAQFILNQNAASGVFSERVMRNENGDLQRLEATYLNIGERRVQGLDLHLGYTLPTRDWGQFSLGLNAAHISEYTLQLDNSAPTENLAGSFQDPAAEGVGGIPRWKGNLGLQWARQRWRGNYDLHVVGSMSEVVPNSTRVRHIDSWVVHDLQFSYLFNLLQGLRLSLGVDNLLDKAPPFVASAFNDNIDGRTHALRGRYWYAKLSQRI